MNDKQAMILVELFLENEALRVARLEKENAALREALKQARKFALNNNYTMRQFALALGITAAQLSAWTDEIPTTEPDFKD
jgi:CRISPR/Cas system-associated protein endoribonuclease Cas2